MPSTHFNNFCASVQELKRIYLDDALAIPTPNPDHQELARAFVTLVHSEMEYYVEEALRDLCKGVVAGAAVGTFSRASIAMLGFGGLTPLNGGTALSNAGKKSARRLATRIGDAHNSVLQIINGNNGVREKHLAAMAIPLGLDTNIVDSTWLSELDAFCSFRGAYAHMSRTSQRGSHLSVNPQDMWVKCERLIWTNQALAGPNLISSFESFDGWVEAEKLSFGPIVTAASWRLRITALLIRAIGAIRRKNEVDNDEE